MRYLILSAVLAVIALLGVTFNTSKTKKKVNTGVQALDLQETTAADYSADRLLCPQVETVPCNCCTVSAASGHQKIIHDRKALIHYLRQRTSANAHVHLNHRAATPT